MRQFLTEDIVRDSAGKILEFKNEKNVQSGVGQLTTFNQLGFKGVSDKPDGWYLPDNCEETAIILETKNSDQVMSEIFNKKCFLNCLSLKDSRLYSCRVTSNVHVLNEYFGTKFEITESDFLDIFKIKNKNEVLEFIKNTHEFCKYCNFNSKIKFSKSKKLSEEWIFKS